MATSQQPIPNLAKVIIKDLFSIGLVPLLLLVVIVVSAMTVVFVTHQTRTEITYKENAMRMRDQLDNEWRNLILEETALSEHSRVQDEAEKELEMHRPDADKEIVIELK